jgi:dihydrofolate synthase/folylpolyglutamate synthase
VWLDGAHNAHGAAALVTTLQALSPQKWMVIFGALDTRPAEAFLSQIQPIAAHIHTLTIADQPAAIEAAILAQTARGLNIPAQPVASPDAALKAIEAMSSPEMPVIICGSLYLAGQVLAQNDTLPD